MPETRQPTPAELDLLRVLWQRGPSTVRDLHAAINREVGYTTVLKLLQIMTEKGLVTRDATSRSHVYVAAVSEDATKRRLLADLLDRAFGGSRLDLVMQALSTTPTTTEELRQIRALLDSLPGESR
jgi:predicted transcriptional regulator